jgi:hypothetical protein
MRSSQAVVHLAVASLVCLPLAGCERKAPGPAECVALADLTLGRQVPRTSHDELVRQCLLTPFDQAMLACVERTGAYSACHRRLELRRLQRR